MSFCGDDGYWQTSARSIVKKIGGRTNRAKFDMVVCQGLSGQCIGFLAAYELGVPLLILRKTSAEEHSKRQSPYRVALLEGGNQIDKWFRQHGKKPRVLFVDDCVSSGKTRARCGRAVFSAGGVVTCEATGDGFSALSTAVQKSFEKYAGGMAW